MEDGKILESWKEIAAYLKRNIRTCQMWEREMGLPIHRLDGSLKARVFAYKDELDRWLDEKLHERESQEKRTKSGKRGAALRTLPRWNKGLIASLATMLMAAIVVSAWLIHRQSKIRWANDVAIPEIERLLLTSESQKIFDLALKAEKYIPKSTRLAQLMPLLHGTLYVKTEPPGAAVYFKWYSEVGEKWEFLGLSPIAERRLAQGYRKWKVEKSGLATTEGTLFIRAGHAKTLDLNLPKEGQIPAEMVHIEEGVFSPAYFNLIPQAELRLPGYSLDRYEVTNRRFKAFLDAGGYSDPQYWRHDFVKNGRSLPWANAMEEFVDKTGRPGPGTWSLGDYPRGQEDYPVTGVSWYEAAAFAEFEGKRLPTIFHWARAAGDYMTDSGFIIPASNFDSKGPAPVGSYPSLGPFGTYDMAGNVKEWCLNEREGKRFILGGGWDEAQYMFSSFDARDGFQRDADFGFRCMKTDPGKAETGELYAPLGKPWVPDFRKFIPCSDEIYKVYEELHAYTKLDLHPRVESREDWSDRTVLEKVTFDDATGEDRNIAYMFLPRGGQPPFQTVVYFPTDGALLLRSIFDYYIVKSREVELFTNAGRAFVFPVLFETLERRSESAVPLPWTRERLRRTGIRRVRDFMRCVDYLETRPDIDRDRLDYLGISWGAHIGPKILALEKRLKAGVLLGAGPGIWPYQTANYSPELDVFNFAPRVKVPVLMLHGRYDYIFPLHTGTTLLWELLGTPAEDKALIIKETGHCVWQLVETRKDVFDFLDKHLGPVKRVVRDQGRR